MQGGASIKCITKIHREEELEFSLLLSGPLNTSALFDAGDIKRYRDKRQQLLLHLVAHAPLFLIESYKIHIGQRNNSRFKLAQFGDNWFLFLSFVVDHAHR